MTKEEIDKFHLLLEKNGVVCGNDEEVEEMTERLVDYAELVLKFKNPTKCF